MYYFTVMGVEQATDLKFIQSIKVPFAIISVVSPEFEEYNIPYNPFCKDILYLRFHDVDSSGNVIGSFNEIQEKIKPISDNDIQQIFEFIEKNKDIEDWIVHCEAGISRSAGVAMALSEIMNDTKNPGVYIETKYPLSFHNVDIKLKLLHSWRKKENISG